MLHRASGDMRTDEDRATGDTRKDEDDPVHGHS